MQPSDRFSAEQLPASVDLRPHMPPIVDQGSVGSCTANALAAAYGYLEGRAQKKQVAVSRLFIYYNERRVEGSVTDDAGAAIGDGVKVLRKWGVCEERTWPYDEKKWQERPHPPAYDEGKGHEVDQAAAVEIDLHAMKHCLAEGYPFVFGLEVGDFQPDAKGFVSRPKKGEELGGHAMICVGYDDAKKAFLIRNSWGTDWGLKGYAYAPYDWMTDEKCISELWTLRRASDLDFAVVGDDAASDEDESDDDEESDDDSDDDDSDDDEESDGEESDDEESDDEEDEDGDDARK